MKRLLAQAILVASGAMVSSYSMALGLGELNLKSALNQPLKAEIELIDKDGLTASEIKPSLAAQAEFDRAGVERLYFLTGIEFKVEGNKISLQTRQPVNEPYLNFIVELNWPSGRVLREYTVLLDPPTFDEQNYQPLVASPVSETTVTTTEVAAPTQPAVVNQWDEPAAPGSYKVQPNDTLWAIALQTRPARDITPQQMMLALQQDNPQAFIGGNINRLKSHYVLNIPTEERIRAIKAQQAVTEVARQNKELTGAAQLDATGRAQAAAPAATSSDGGEVRLLTPKASGAKSGASGDASENVQALENDLAIALENADKSQRENAELESKLTSLQQQVETLQKLINLKDDQLAALQSGAQTANTSGVADATKGAQVDFNYSEAPAAAAEPTPAETANTAAAPAEVAQAPAVNAEQEAAKAAEAEVKAKAAAEAKEKERRARMAALMAEQQRQQQEVSLIDELLSDPVIPAGIAGVVLLIALLVFRAVKKRKANASSVALAGDSDVHPDADVVFKDFEANNDSLNDFDDFELDEQPQANQRKASFAASEEDLVADQYDGKEQEADVLSEADYAISYGKFDEAVSRLKDAIKLEPLRTDLHLKLLEVYATMDDAKGFANAEQELMALGDAAANSEARKYRELLSSPIAVDDAFAPTTEQNDLAEEFADGLDFADALDLDDFEELKEPSVIAEDSAAVDDVPVLAEEDNSLDFDFDDAPAAPVAPATEPAVAHDDNSLDFDLGDFDKEFAAEVAAAEPEESIEALDVPEFDTDAQQTPAKADNGIEFEIDDSSFAEADDVELVSEQTPSELESELDDLESLLDGEDAGANAVSEPSFELDDIKLDDESLTESAEVDLADLADDALEFDLNAQHDTASTGHNEPADAAASLEDIDLDQLAKADNEFDFLAGTDECATKLDLARAYIDMEDKEGARELLQEVVQEGSEEQKAQARELISNL